VGKISKYDIAYKGLKEGKHKFEYQIDDKFFELFDVSLVQKANVQVKVTFEKRSTLLTLLFKIKGTVELTCDRCLENYNQPIKLKAELFVKFGEAKFEEGDDVLWVLPDEHHINIAQLLYEYVILSIPIKHVHPNDKNGNSTCNIEMIEQINKYSCIEKEEEPDQRWEVLKRLKNNN
jgi:uncharacterized protein